MISIKDFIEKLDAQVPPELQAAMQDDMQKADKEDFSWIEFINLQERARVITIKDIISSTHKWTAIECVDSKGYRNDAFWCQACDIRASVFEHINTISIISKVKDNKPTYTVHNQYLMFTCQEAQALKANSKQQCFDCGITEKGQSSNYCNMVDIY